jgi:hypothetical protein
MAASSKIKILKAETTEELEHLYNEFMNDREENGYTVKWPITNNHFRISENIFYLLIEYQVIKKL